VAISNRLLRYANEAVRIMETAAKSGKGGAQFVPGVLDRRVTVELAAGYRSEAEADAARALRMFQEVAQPGQPSRILGRAYLILARALAAQGKTKKPGQPLSPRRNICRQRSVPIIPIPALPTSSPGWIAKLDKPV
jgi:hypothetical protein